jgi:hypothetical protein
MIVEFFLNRHYLYKFQKLTFDDETNLAKVILIIFIY